MQSRSNSSTTILIIVLLIFTFPIWIGIAGGIFGLIAGIFGAVIGVIAGVFGAVFGVIGGIFGWIFDWDTSWHWPFHFWSGKMFILAAIVLVIVVLTRPRRI